MRDKTLECRTSVQSGLWIWGRVVYISYYVTRSSISINGITLQSKSFMSTLVKKNKNETYKFITIYLKSIHFVNYFGDIIDVWFKRLYLVMMMNFN